MTPGFTESDEQLERRLMVQCRTRRITTLTHPYLTPTMKPITAKVEVTWIDEDGVEQGGFYLVNVPDVSYSGPDEQFAADHHPATLAQDVVEEAAERGDIPTVTVEDVYHYTGTRNWR